MRPDGISLLIERADDRDLIRTEPNRAGSPPQTQTRRPRSGPLNDEAPYFYTQAGPNRYSPGTRPYPLPGSSSYSSYRHSLAEETTTRHVRALEHQVRVMGEVLHQEQHEHATTRATSHSVLQSLIEAVAGLDKDGRYHAECALLLPRMSPSEPYGADCLPLSSSQCKPLTGRCTVSNPPPLLRLRC